MLFMFTSIMSMGQLSGTSWRSSHSFMIRVTLSSLVKIWLFLTDVLLEDMSRWPIMIIRVFFHCLFVLLFCLCLICFSLTLFLLFFIFCFVWHLFDCGPTVHSVALFTLLLCSCFLSFSFCFFFCFPLGCSSTLIFVHFIFRLFFDLFHI